MGGINDAENKFRCLPINWKIHIQNNCVFSSMDIDLEI